MIQTRFSEELEELEKLARIRKLYLSDYSQLKRNFNLSHIVHTTLHLSQFVSKCFINLIMNIFFFFL